MIEDCEEELAEGTPACGMQLFFQVGFAHEIRMCLLIVHCVPDFNFRAA